ncbi:hypothetical protein D1F79_14155 [Staphylococcus aureus]|nr:hypothetical protein D1F79_14155 [Staphylococcus aureus]
MSFFIVFCKKVLSYFCDKCCIQCHKSVTLDLNLISLWINLKPLECLALPDISFLNDSKFPLCSYGIFRDKLKFLSF